MKLTLEKQHMFLFYTAYTMSADALATLGASTSAGIAGIVLDPNARIVHLQHQCNWPNIRGQKWPATLSAIKQKYNSCLNMQLSLFKQPNVLDCKSNPNIESV